MTGQRVGYIRVSTLDQNPERQLEGVQLHRKYIDKLSGKNTERPQLQEMLSFVREGDTIIVHSLDRLGRNLDDLRKLVTQLTEKGVRIEFIKENLTFTGDDTAMSKLLLSIMGAFSEFERALIGERQREGIILAKKKGAYQGRRKKLNDEQLAEIQQMRQQGVSKSAIARQFNISRPSLYRYLKAVMT